jgi:hypothetical protein
LRVASVTLVGLLAKADVVAACPVRYGCGSKFTGRPLENRDRPMTLNTEKPAVERWVEEQLFEEDVRAVLMMIRPNRRERLKGWSEYRTGGADFRATISWSGEFQTSRDCDIWRVPRIAEVLESILIGAVRDADEMLPQQEFEHYRRIVRALAARIDELESCYT